jgi:hypothetical protein
MRIVAKETHSSNEEQSSWRKFERKFEEFGEVRSEK